MAAPATVGSTLSLTPAPVAGPAPTPSAAKLAESIAIFGTQEVQLNKVDDCNAIVFSVPARSSLLLKLTTPRSHAYEERDLRWLHLLQSVAVVPSRRAETIAKLVAQAIQLIRSPRFKLRLEQAVRGLLDVVAKSDATTSLTRRSMLALRLKDAVASFLRDWIKDPVEGFVLRKDHVVGGMRLDDLVATPVGAAYLRGFRRDDGFCVVVFPWGHGFIHLSKVERLDVAIESERKKRHHHEYLALEHQQLFEQVESLLENYPPAGADQSDGDSDVLAEYKALLMELQSQHVDPEIVQQDLSFVRRVQALAAKLHKRQRTQSITVEDDPEDMEDVEEEVAAVGEANADESRAAEEEESKRSEEAPVKVEDDPMLG